MKTVIICCDGTSQGSESKSLSNVRKIFSALPGVKQPVNSLKCDDLKIDPTNSYEVLYYRGIGIDNFNKPPNSESGLKELISLLFARLVFTIKSTAKAAEGSDIVKRVEAVLDDVEKLLEPKEKIRFYFVGYSRGAATVRLVAKYLSQIYPNIEIEHILLFDTVYSVFSEIQIKDFPKIKAFTDTQVGNHVKYCDHLIAGDEMRDKFPLAPVDSRTGVEQILLSGAHSDIGGGAGTTGLSDNTLIVALNLLKNRGLQFSEENVKSLNIKPNLNDEINWDTITGIGQKHYPRNYRNLDFKIHKSVFERFNLGKSAPIALVQLSTIASNAEGDLIELNQITFSNSSRKSKLNDTATLEINH